MGPDAAARSENATVATYDDFGRKLSVDDADRGVWTLTCDGLGRPRTQINARGIEPHEN